MEETRKNMVARSEMFVGCYPHELVRCTTPRQPPGFKAILIYPLDLFLMFDGLNIYIWKFYKSYSLVFLSSIAFVTSCLLDILQLKLSELFLTILQDALFGEMKIATHGRQWSENQTYLMHFKELVMSVAGSPESRTSWKRCFFPQPSVGVGVPLLASTTLISCN
jgi:hypothetical protein